MTLDTLPTPTLLLDRNRLIANLEAMNAQARRLGVDLRPHLKTTKSVPIARLATAGHSGGITVSTLREADYFRAAGFDDILYAVGMVPSKLEAVARLEQAGARMTIVVDNVAAARGIAERAASLGQPIRAMIEIDCDNHRSGAEPMSDEALEIAGELARAPAIAFMGVMTHAGGAYDCPTTDEIVAMAEQERRAAVGTADMLRARGIAVPVVSVGSTPTAVLAADLTGVTEFRPGNYLLKDMTMVGLGICSPDEIAASVLTTVIGHNPRQGLLITDAGGLALSKDLGLDRPGEPRSFGGICDADGRYLEDLFVCNVNQEHGMIRSRAGLDLTGIAIGTRLRVLPQHVCMTAAAYDRYRLTQPDDRGATEWERCNGW